MRNSIKNIIFSAARFLPFNYLKKGKYPTLLPFYHTVEKKQPQYIGGYRVKNEQQFEKDLDFLLKHYEPIGLNDLKNQQNIPQNAMHISFDDGMKSCSNNIAPILLRKGIPATFFINPSFVDNSDLFHRFIFDMAKKQKLKLSEELKTYPNKASLFKQTEVKESILENNIKNTAIYMGMHELKQLNREGFTIGAHSMDHPEFYNIEPEEQYRQVKESMQWVEKHFNPSAKAFAFPFTDYGVGNALLQKIHTENLIDISFGTAGLKHDNFPNHLQRIPMEKKHYQHASRILKYEHFYFRIRGLMNKNTAERDD